MRVHNRTNKEQKIKINDRQGYSYTVYIIPDGTTTLEPNQVSKDVYDLINKGILEDVTAGSSPSVAPQEIVINTNNGDDETTVCDCNIQESEITNESDTVESEDSVSEEVTPEEVVTEVTEVVEDSKISDNPSVFTCDICGSEHASARGLQMHINKVHSQESNK